MQSHGADIQRNRSGCGVRLVSDAETGKLVCIDKFGDYTKVVMKSNRGYNTNMPLDV